MIKSRQKLGKYRIERKLGEGGFAVVYQAYDTIEGIRVALKIPYAQVLDASTLEAFQREVRMASQLDHPNILPIKNADFIEGRFVVAFPLGERTLLQRLQSRMSLNTALDFAEQMLDAVAYAHERRVIHCDVKPENLILFSDNRLMLSDFGLAKVALRTIHASGSGTVGYVAPEQAMGKPSARSDVFSLGLIIYRMFAGQLPEWPYDWPPPGIERMRRSVHADLIEMCRRAILVDPRKRYRDCGQMYGVFLRLKPQALLGRSRRAVVPRVKRARDWKTIRRQQFEREFGKLLETRHACVRCQGPVSEFMTHCPWCGDDRARHEGGTRFPLCCPRCERGMKLDWAYCPWCFGRGFEVQSARHYSDRRYAARCTNKACVRKLLMPFMRYCPWCHRKVREHWTISKVKDTCPSCHWGVAKDYWSFCPWCGDGLGRSI